MPFLVIDIHASRDGNSLEDCMNTYETENEMLVAVENEAKELVEQDIRYFEDWSTALEVYEIVRKVPLNIDVAVTVDVAKPEEPEPDPVENIVRGIFDEAKRRGGSYSSPFYPL